MSDNPKADGNNITKVMFGGSLVILVLLVAFVWVLPMVISTPTERGQFGDQFGAVNALFSGLAFLGLIVTIAFQTRGLRLQSRDLRLQTEALRLQIKEFSEQKEEMKRSAEAQEMANKLKALELWSSTRKMLIDIAIKNAEIEPTEGQRRSELKKVEDHVRKMEDTLLRDLKAIGFIQGNSNDTV